MGKMGEWIDLTKYADTRAFERWGEARHYLRSNKGKPVGISHTAALAFARQLPEVVALEDFVRRVEWFGYDEDDRAICFYCVALKTDGHTEECPVPKVLAPFEESADA